MTETPPGGADEPAYPTGAQLVADLPLDPEDRPIDADEAQIIVDRWAGRMRDAGATTITHTSAYIVALGAGAEVMRKMLRRSGYVETKEADDDLQRADRMIRDFDAEVYSPTELGETPPASVHNVTPEPLW